MPAMKNAPCVSGNSAEGEDQNTQQREPINMNTTTSVSPSTVTPIDAPNATPEHQEIRVPSKFSSFNHHIDDYDGTWRVQFVEPNSGDSMSTDDARAYVKECLRAIGVAEQLNAAVL